MNDYDPALMIAVERIVRPVFAHFNTKLRMREELYGLLSEIYNEEAARAVSPEEALRESIRRLGDAESLTSELQASVPWHNFPVVRKLPFISNRGEGTHRMSDGRLSLAVAVFSFCLFIPVIGLVGLFAPTDKLARVSNLLLLLTAFQFLGPLCFTLLVRRTMACFELQGKIERLEACAVVAIVATALTFVGLTSLFYVSLWNLADSLAAASDHLLAVTAAGGIVLLVGWATHAEHAKLRPWLDLDIEHQPEATTC